MAEHQPGSGTDAEYLVNQIAHALRNPIFAAQVQLDALSLRTAHLDEARKSVETLQRQVKRIEQLVAEMLLFGRPAEARRTRVRVGELVTQVAADYRRGTRQEPAEVDAATAGVDLVAQWDPQAVRVVLERLLDNAVQHTPPPHRVELRVEPAGDGWVELVVRDHGDGIPDDLRPRVMLPFFPQHRGRPGLGLPIAAKFTALLGGTLTLDSQPGAGTEVRVRLPLQPVGA